MTLTLKLHRGYEVKLRLVTSKERVEKFRGWGNYELVVKYDGRGFWVSVYFRRAVKTVRPRTVMAIDLSFDNVTLAVLTLDGRLVRLRRFRTPHRKLLTHRMWIERIQGRYPRSWRFVKGVRRAIEGHGERIRSISRDYAHRVGDLVAGLALKHHSIIVLEDLEKLRENGKRGREFNKRLGLWFYRRVQFCVEYEARERNLEVVKVDPRGLPRNALGVAVSCLRMGIEY
jgi:putative transposase